MYNIIHMAQSRGLNDAGRPRLAPSADGRPGAQVAEQAAPRRRRWLRALTLRPSARPSGP